MTITITRKSRKQTIPVKALVQHGHRLPDVAKHHPNWDWSAMLTDQILGHVGKGMPELVRALPHLNWAKIFNNNVPPMNEITHFRLGHALLEIGQHNAVTKIIRCGKHWEDWVLLCHRLDLQNDAAWQEMLERAVQHDSRARREWFETPKLWVFQRILRQDQQNSAHKDKPCKVSGLMRFLQKNPQWLDHLAPPSAAQTTKPRQAPQALKP